MEFAKAATNHPTSKVFKNGNFKVQLPNQHEGNYSLDVIDLASSCILQLKVKRPLNSNSILFKNLKEDEIQVKEYKRQKVRIYYEDSFVRLFSRERFEDEIVYQEPTPLEDFKF